MGMAITLVKLSKNPVNVKEEIKIQMAVHEITEEPNMYRLPYQLGKPKGNMDS